MAAAIINKHKNKNKTTSITFCLFLIFKWIIYGFPWDLRIGYTLENNGLIESKDGFNEYSPGKLWLSTIMILTSYKGKIRKIHFYEASQ